MARRKPRGWRGDPERHALARRGIKSGGTRPSARVIVMKGPQVEIDKLIERKLAEARKLMIAAKMDREDVAVELSEYEASLRLTYGNGR